MLYTINLYSDCKQDNRMNNVPGNFQMLPNCTFFWMMKHNYLVVYLPIYGVFLIHVNLKIVWIRSKTCKTIKELRISASLTTSNNISSRKLC